VPEIAGIFRQEIAVMAERSRVEIQLSEPQQRKLEELGAGLGLSVATTARAVLALILNATAERGPEDGGPMRRWIAPFTA
jgi:hypothetical protein